MEMRQGAVLLQVDKLLEANLFQDLTSLCALNQLYNPRADSILLNSHDQEVNAVNWHMILTPNAFDTLFAFENTSTIFDDFLARVSSDSRKIETGSDDSTVSNNSIRII